MERGNTKHGPAQDEQLKHEAQPIVQGHGGSSHVEEWRQTEPMPDDTDDAEVVAASGIDGEERDPGAPASAASPATDGDLGGEDEVIFSTETQGGAGDETPAGQGGGTVADAPGAEEAAASTTDQEADR
jgi:hypothetical protein